MYKPLLSAAILLIPCSVFAGQAMPLEDGFAIASTTSAREVDAVGAPLQDASGSSDAAREVSAAASRGSDEADSHSHSPRGGHAQGGSGGGDGATPLHPHRGHGKAPWQSLLPGAMK